MHWCVGGRTGNKMAEQPTDNINAAVAKMCAAVATLAETNAENSAAFKELLETLGESAKDTKLKSFSMKKML